MMQILDKVYCLDSSALIDMHKYYNIPSLWEELENLFSDNRVISHRIVFEELTTQAKRPSSLSKWVSKKSAYFKPMTAVQAKHVASIINEFPKLIDPYSEKDQADPWLIALILEERSNPTFFNSNINMIVVSQENTLSSCKIPAVCKRFDIRHFSLFEFFNDNGWKLKLEKS